MSATTPLWVPFATAGGAWALAEASGYFRWAREARQRREEWRRDQRGATYRTLSAFLVQERVRVGLLSVTFARTNQDLAPQPMSENDWHGMHGDIWAFGSRRIRKLVDALLDERITFNNALADLREVREDREAAKGGPIDRDLLDSGRTARADLKTARDAIRQYTDKIAVAIRDELGSND